MQVPQVIDELLSIVKSKRALFTDALNSAGKKGPLQTNIHFELIKRKLYDFDVIRAMN